MKTSTQSNLLLFLFFFIFAFNGFAQVRPNTFLMNPDLLMQNKFRINAGNEQCLSALKILLSNTSVALTRAPYTIVNKTMTPPSGDKHDYLSLATYWWPNPNTSTGLPYIKKDGQMNPEVNEIKDMIYVRELSKDIRLLGLSYYFTNDEKYAKKAAELLKVFFLNSATKMNPNLNYTQIVRGLSTENGVGTIDTERFVDLIDGVQLIVGSSSWTAEDHEALKGWFNQYLNWMLTSTVGLEGAAQPNNIGTFHNLQVVSYALFVGNKTLAKSLIEKQAYSRIESQFTVDGKQTLELARTNSWTYSTKNLEAWFKLASCAESAGINLWDYTTPSGKSLKKAFQWMLPYASGSKAWPYQQISTLSLDQFVPIGRTGSAIYKDVNLQPVLSPTHAKFVSGSMMDLLVSRYY